MSPFSMLLKLVLVFFIGAVFAQSTTVQKIKTGDSVTQELSFLDIRGREVYVSRKVTNTGVADITDSGKTFTYQNGTITKFDSNYSMTYQKAFGGQESIFTGKYVRAWKPKDLVPGEKEPLTLYVPVPACGGDSKVTYDKVTVSEATRALKIGDTEKSIPVSVVDMSGTWAAGRCGTGKVIQKVIYSKELDLVLLTRSENYDPSGFLNAQGSMEVSIVSFNPKN